MCETNAKIRAVIATSTSTVKPVKATRMRDAESRCRCSDGSPSSADDEATFEVSVEFVASFTDPSYGTERKGHNRHEFTKVLIKEPRLLPLIAGVREDAVILRSTATPQRASNG
jgi:hypothetical protein